MHSGASRQIQILPIEAQSLTSWLVYINRDHRANEDVEVGYTATQSLWRTCGGTRTSQTSDQLVGRCLTKVPELTGI